MSDDASQQPGRRPSRRGLAALLLILAFAAGIHLPALDHAYLPGWDEAIHAAVAANLAEHPATPTLFDAPFLPLDYRNWQENHIWLHMPPLPFWQAAAGLAVGGRSLFWLRLPGWLLFCATLVGLYLLGLRLYREEAGLLGAALYAAAPFGWLQVQGYHFGDMTDVGLAFWLTACCLCMLRAIDSGRLRWAALAGLCQAAALLTKSALALAPAGAALVLFAAPRLGLRLRPAVRWWLPALQWGLGLALWWAWRLSCWWRWPREYAHETEAQWLHVIGDYEGHGRPWDALFNTLPANLFTPELLLLGLVAVGWVAWQAWQRRHTGLGLHALWLLGGWLPLLAVQTKVPALLFGLAPALALAIGALVVRLAALRTGTWTLALAWVPLLAHLLAPLAGAAWFAFAAPFAPDMAAVPHLPLQLGLLLGLAGGLWLIGHGLRAAAPATFGPRRAEAAGHRWPARVRWLVAAAGLVTAFGLVLAELHTTRGGFAIIAGINPVRTTARSIEPALAADARLVFEGRTNGRQRPALAASFFTGRPAHLVAGHAVARAVAAAARHGPVVLFSPVRRQAEPMLAPAPDQGWWVYAATDGPPAPATPAAGHSLARYPRAPDLLRLELDRRRLPAGSRLAVLAVWRAQGPASRFATQIVLQPAGGGSALAPYPAEHDFPTGLQGVHLHDLAPPGLFWGHRPLGTGLGEPHRWRAGWEVADAFSVWIPRHLPPGRYRLVQRLLDRGRPLAPREPVDWPWIEVRP